MTREELEIDVWRSAANAGRDASAELEAFRKACPVGPVDQRAPAPSLLEQSLAANGSASRAIVQVVVAPPGEMNTGPAHEVRLFREVGDLVYMFDFTSLRWEPASHAGTSFTIAPAWRLTRPLERDR